MQAIRGCEALGVDICLTINGLVTQFCDSEVNKHLQDSRNYAVGVATLRMTENYRHTVAAF